MKDNHAYIIARISGLLLQLLLVACTVQRPAQKDASDLNKSAFRNLPWTRTIQPHFMPLTRWLSSANDEASKTGAEFPGHAILFGPPGGGIKQIASAIAKDGNAKFISRDATSHLWNKSKLDSLAQNTERGTVLYIHQIHLWLKDMSRADQTNFKNWLAQLPQKQTVLIGYSNRPDLIPQGLFNAFSLRLGIDRPDIEGRKIIFEHELKKMRARQDVSADTLAAMTPGFSVEDIWKVCAGAGEEAGSNNRMYVGFEDFEKTINALVEKYRQESGQGNKEEEQRHAIIIASQIVAGHYLPYAPAILEIGIKRRGTSYIGYLKFEGIDTTSELSIEDGIAVFLASKAGDHLLNEKPKDYYKESLDKAEKLSRQLVILAHSDQKLSPRPDMEVLSREVLSMQYNRVTALLTTKLDEVKKIASVLQKRKVLREEDIEALFEEDKNK